MNNSEKQKGVVLIFTVFFVTLIMASAFALSAIFIPKVRLSFDTRNSISALYAADSGIEWCLFVDRKGTSSPLSPAPPTFDDVEVSFTTKPSDCSSFPVKATGSYRGINRALEVNI